MAFTGRLGTDESQPGNIQPGAEGSWSDEGAFQSDAFQNDAFQTEDAGARTATDSVTTSESATRSAILSRTATDATSTSESAEGEVSGAGEVNRTASDSASLSESATRAIAGTRSTTDAPTTSDTAPRSQALARTTTRAVSLSESAEAHRSFIRTLTDDVAIDQSITDDFTRSEASSWGTGPLGEWITEGGTTLSVDGDEAVSVGSAFMNQSISLSAEIIAAQHRTISTRFLLPSSGNTSLGIELVGSGGLYAALYFTENATSQDTLEVSTPGDSDDTTVTFTRGQFGILKLDFDRTTGGVRGKVWESSGAEPGWQVSFVDPGLLGAELHTLAITRDSSTSTTAKWDWVTVEVPSQDSILNYRSFSQFATDAIALSESVATGPTAEATESITTSESATRLAAFFRRITQTVSTTSPATRQITSFRTATDGVTTADAGAVVTVRTASDAVTATDSATAEKSYVRTAKDSTTGAISVWPMDDAGSSLRDDLDSNPLTVSGTIPTYQVSSPTGGGVAFNNSAYFQKTSPSGLSTGAAARTIEFWFKGTTSSKQTIFSYGTNTTRRSYSIAINEGGSNRIGVWTFGDDGSVSAPGINNNTWHRVTVTFDGTTTSFYMDGALLGTDTYGGALNTLVSAAGLVVGRDHHTAANFARSGSSVSGLRFWDRALSAAEVAGDTVARSAALARVYHFEAAFATDIATRSIDRFRAISDTTTTTESTGELVGEAYDRTATESVALSEAATQTTADKYRSLSDNASESTFTDDFDRGSLGANYTQIGSRPLPIIDSNALSTDTGTGDPYGVAELTATLGFTAPIDIQFDFLTGATDPDGWFYYEVAVDHSVVGVYWDTSNLRLYYESTFASYDIETADPNTWYTIKAHADHTAGATVNTKFWAVGDPEPGSWLNTHVLSATTTYAAPFSIYIEHDNDAAPLPYLDNLIIGAVGITDSISVTQTVTRTVTDTTEIVDWIVNNGTVSTPVYGQVPNGYQPQLAAPIDATQTTITVTQPLPPGTDLPILVFLPDGFEYVLVTAVSPDGLTWTVVRGQNQTAGTTHSGGSVLPANTTVSIGGIDYTAYVLLNKMRLTTYANGQVGTGEIGIFLAGSFVATGAEVVVRHRNVRVWGGYIANIKRTYPFPAGGGEPGQDVGWSTLEVVDYNILLRKRIYHDKDTPTHMKVKQWPNGTQDDVVIGHMLAHFLNIGGDGLSFDLHHVGTPGLRVDSCDPNHTDYFQIAWAGYTWQDAMRAIADETGAVYYIDPDKTFRYVDDSTKQSVFGFTGLSDDPGGSVIGYRDFELSSDGTKLVNEQFTWGMGQGATEPVLGHEFDSGSVTEHGLWQQAEVRFDMYCQGTVDLRAQTWLDGSPQNRRGYKNNRVAARATVFTPYFRVADVITLESTTFDFSDTIPIRGAEITFPTPWDIQNVLTISHEKDTPWEAYEFAFPRFNFDFDFDIDPVDPVDPWSPYDPCAEPTPTIVSGGQATDPDTFPPSQTVRHHLIGWDSDDAPPSGAAYWEFFDLVPEQTWSQNFSNPPCFTGFGFGFADRVYHSGIFRTPTGAIDEGPPINSLSSGYRTFRAPENEVTPNGPVYAHISGTVSLTGVMKNRPQYPDVAGFQTGLYEEPLPPINVVISLLLEDGISVVPDAIVLGSGPSAIYRDGFYLNQIGSPIWEGTLTEAMGEVPVDTYVSVPSGKHFATSVQISTGTGVETVFPDGMMEIVWSGGNGPGEAVIVFDHDFVTYSHTEPAGFGEGDSGGDCAENWLTEANWIVDEDYTAGDPMEFTGSSLEFTTTPDFTPSSAAIALPVDWGTEVPVSVYFEFSFHGYYGSSMYMGFDTTEDFGAFGTHLGILQRGFSEGPYVGQSGIAVFSINGNEIDPDEYPIPGTIGGPFPRTVNLKMRIEVYELTQARYRVWEASAPEPSTWLFDDFIGAFREPNFVRIYYLGTTLSEDTFAFITTIEVDCEPADPCVDVDPGDLAESPDDSPMYGVSPTGGVELDNGNFLYTFAQQFLPSSTEVWADGLRLRLTEDYTEHPENAAIEIHADAQSGFTVFDPSMSIVANMVAFVAHDPPPEYVEP